VYASCSCTSDCRWSALSDVGTLSTPARPSFASLFCGCGGFDIGFIQAGFNCVAAFDLDPIAVRTHGRNLGQHAYVVDLSVDGPLPVSLKGIDLLAAGPPCQGFSTMGRRDPKDPRNSLMLRVGDIAIATRPKVVVVENVIGVIAGVQQSFWHLLQHRLRSAGYHTVDFQIDVRDLGLAQTRRRMILLAYRTKSLFNIAPACESAATLREALRGVAGQPNHSPRPLIPVSLGGRIAPYIKRGQKLCNVRTGPACVPSWKVPAVFGAVTRREARLLEALRRLRRCNRVRGFGDADPVAARTLSAALGEPVRNTLTSLIEKGYRPIPSDVMPRDEVPHIG
jgi:DNA (cytosine-5)-methyltransferase 1